jgi:hypothetical protein
MNASGLRQRLASERINPDAYSLDDATANEAYCLVRSTQGWIVYYFERGYRRGERRFEFADAACQYLLNLILRDPTTRVRR